MSALAKSIYKLLYKANKDMEETVIKAVTQAMLELKLANLLER